MSSAAAPWTKETALAHPDQVAWNWVLATYQFTQDELLQVRDHLDLRAMIKTQRCLTRAWLREHFHAEIEESPHVHWGLVEHLVPE